MGSNVCYHREVDFGGSSLRAFRTAICTLTLGLGAPRAGAETAPDLAVDCPQLSSEQLPSLEARVRADFALLPAAEGQLRIRCADDQVFVDYTSSEVATRSASTALSDDKGQWVEQILALTHTLTTAASEPARGSAQPKPSPAATPLPSSAPRATAPNSITHSDNSLPDTHESRAATPTLTLAQADLGLCSEIWPSPTLALLGPCAAFGLRLSSRWSVAITGEAAWGTTRPDAIALRNLAAGVEARFGQSIWLAAGVHVVALRLTPDPDLSPRSHQVYEPMFTVRSGHSIVLGRHSLAASVGLRGFPEYHDVHVDGQKVFRIPPLALIFALEYGLEL